MNNKDLTIKQLKDYGFSVVMFQSGSWKISRESRNKAGKISQNYIDVSSGYVCFSFGVKKIKISLDRFLWVWFFEDLTKDEAIIHADNVDANFQLWNLMKIPAEKVIPYKFRTKEEIERDVKARQDEMKASGMSEFYKFSR